MARYEAIDKVYLHFPADDGEEPRLIRPGEKLSYDGWPNAQMKPLDAEARENVEMLAEYRASGQRLPRNPAEARKLRGAAAPSAEQSTEPKRRGRPPKAKAA